MYKYNDLVLRRPEKVIGKLFSIIYFLFPKVLKTIVLLFNCISIM